MSECVAIATQLNIQFVTQPDGTQVLLDGEDVTQTIRTERVGEYASKVAAVPELRTALLARQHAFAQAPGLVADGRDMATSIFPNAQAKIYLTASAESRAQRRVKQLQGMGLDAKNKRHFSEYTGSRQTRHGAHSCSAQARRRCLHH